MNRFILVLLLGILGGPGIAYMGWEDRQLEAQYAAEGIDAPGTVVAGHSTKRKRSTSYVLKVSWTPKDKPVMQKDFSVTKDFYNSVSNLGIGSPVPVRYLPGKEDDAIIKGGKNWSTELLPVGIGWFVVGLLTLWWRQRQA